MTGIANVPASGGIAGQVQVMSQSHCRLLPTSTGHKGKNKNKKSARWDVYDDPELTRHKETFTAHLELVLVLSLLSFLI